LKHSLSEYNACLSLWPCDMHRTGNGQSPQRIRCPWTISWTNGFTNSWWFSSDHTWQTMK
jgi:hypothetical protein